MATALREPARLISSRAPGAAGLRARNQKHRVAMLSISAVIWSIAMATAVASEEAAPGGAT
jgi:hypothetical protein